MKFLLLIPHIQLSTVNVFLAELKRYSEGHVSASVYNQQLV